MSAPFAKASKLHGVIGHTVHHTSHLTTAGEVWGVCWLVTLCTPPHTSPGLAIIQLIYNIFLLNRWMESRHHISYFVIWTQTIQCLCMDEGSHTSAVLYHIPCKDFSFMSSLVLDGVFCSCIGDTRWLVRGAFRGLVSAGSEPLGDGVASLAAFLWDDWFSYTVQNRQ